jgi:hypothetical protein
LQYRARPLESDRRRTRSTERRRMCDDSGGGTDRTPSVRIGGFWQTAVAGYVDSNGFATEEGCRREPEFVLCRSCAASKVFPDCRECRPLAISGVGRQG